MNKETLQYVIAKNRRSLPLRLIAGCSEKYLRAWYNQNRWGFTNNGEAFVLARFGQWAEGRKVTIWDVGAHGGEWSEAAHKMVPFAMVHSFEIIPEIASTLTDTEWRSAHGFGLSNAEAMVDVHWNKGHNTESSINPRAESVTYRTSPVEVIRCHVHTGDKLVGELGHPDFLKIDTEGHEAYVLRGFSETLGSSSAPALIQFEYGTTYVPSGTTLRDIYSLLPGYSIGRLYPDYVEFKSYDYSDEHLRMGNMIATRDQALKKLLVGLFVGRPGERVNLEGLVSAAGVADLEAVTGGGPGGACREVAVLLRPGEERLDVDGAGRPVQEVLVVGARLPDPFRAEDAHVPWLAIDRGRGLRPAVVETVGVDVGLDHDLIVPVVEPQVIRCPSGGLGVVGDGGAE
jgi:FkbM family methyltransferase